MIHTDDELAEMKKFYKNLLEKNLKPDIYEDMLDDILILLQEVKELKQELKEK